MTERLNSVGRNSVCTHGRPNQKAKRQRKWLLLFLMQSAWRIHVGRGSGVVTMWWVTCGKGEWGQQESQERGGREADTGGEVARRWNAVSTWGASIASRGRTNRECTSGGRECWDIVTVLGGGQHTGGKGVGVHRGKSHVRCALRTRGRRPRQYTRFLVQTVGTHYAQMCVFRWGVPCSHSTTNGCRQYLDVSEGHVLELVQVWYALIRPRWHARPNLWGKTDMFNGTAMRERVPLCLIRPWSILPHCQHGQWSSFGLGESTQSCLPNHWVG